MIAKSSTPSTNPVIVLAAAQALACICSLICGTASADRAALKMGDGSGVDMKFIVIDKQNLAYV
ncbi:hypothetical protein [Paenibacillus riograndensis]|uniref:hypothetical protein n=1 Tax=Paenibacillus riograndensis TaxID=483937 RepID=UPI001146D337|nr:hypothetical protein [Paenibacillus riograndensis]